jgi:MFS family permease
MKRPENSDYGSRGEALPDRARLALYAILLVASLSYNFSFILIDYIRPFLVRDLGMALNRTALLYAIQGSGVIIGALIIPPLVARLGSRLVLIGSALLMALCTAVTMRTGAFASWAVMRLCVGIALAGCYVSSMTMLANFFPPRVRGRLLAMNMSMFSVALLTAGAIGSLAGASGWRILVLVAALMPVGVALLTIGFLPDDRRYAVYGETEEASKVAITGGSWAQMLAKGRWPLTLTCLVLAGLNFSGYQFYSGFITTYLMTVRHFDPAVVGLFVTVDGLGTLAGSLLWGTIADRIGRRVNALGFGCTAIFIVLFLVAPPARWLLLTLEFGYAVCLSATNCWAAYFAELFPVRLRPMGTSLFHGGHIVSLAAPLIVATVARSHSLVAGMALAPMTFLAAAILWWTLPETLRSSPLYRGFSAESPARPR